MRYKNLVVIGTSHIAAQSLNEVKAALMENPDIVALELDHKRMHALLSERGQHVGLSSVKQLGIKGFLFVLVGSFVQRRLGKLVGMEPGSEMKAAFLIAREKNLPVALIDQDIEVTIRNLSKSLSWKEKMHFAADLLNGLFFGKKHMKSMGITFDLSTVPSKELISRILKKVEARYPALYKVLVSDRNELMAGRLAGIMKNNPDKSILAVVGAGHEEDIIGLIKKYEL